MVRTRDEAVGEVECGGEKGRTASWFSASSASAMVNVAITKISKPRARTRNSDGDFRMLEWTTSGDGARLGVLIHHTDGDREWAYDRDSHIGRLDRGLDEAADREWVVVDMKRDWKVIFPERR